MARKKKKSRTSGGNRPGAGRKPMNPKDKMVSTSFALSRDLLVLIDKQRHKEEMDRSKLIRLLVVEGLQRRGVKVNGSKGSKKTKTAVKPVAKGSETPKPAPSARKTRPIPVSMTPTCAERVKKLLGEEPITE